MDAEAMHAESGAPAEEDDEVDRDLRDVDSLLVLWGGCGHTARHLEGILERLTAGEQRDRREERRVGRHALVHIIPCVRDRAVEGVHVLAEMAMLYGLAKRQTKAISRGVIRLTG
eukprot:COSAG06_NODE_4140_length_4533_cov_3.136446_4_plen_115_part_00